MSQNPPSHTLSGDRLYSQQNKRKHSKVFIARKSKEFLLAVTRVSPSCLTPLIAMQAES